MKRVYASNSIRRRQIAEAALAQLDEGGLSGLTIRAIAARIDIADGSIFRHFKSKNEILLATLDVLEDLLFDSREETDDALEKLGRFFRHRAKLLGGRDTFGRLIFSDQLISAVGDEGRERVRGWSMRSKTIVKDCLEQLAASGRIRMQIPLDEYVSIIKGRLLAFSRERALTSEPITDLEAKISTAWTALVDLILESPGSSGEGGV